MRVFTDKDFEILKTIHCLKASGMQTEEIMELIRPVLPEDESIDALLRIPRKRRLEVEKQMAELRKTLDVVNFKCWYCEIAQCRETDKSLQDLRKKQKVTV